MEGFRTTLQKSLLAVHTVLLYFEGVTVPLWVQGWMDKGPLLEQIVFKGIMFSRRLGVGCVSR